MQQNITGCEIVHVEGCYGGICLYADYLKPALGCSSWGMDLAMYVSGKFVKGLVIFASEQSIRLI